MSRLPCGPTCPSSFDFYVSKEHKKASIVSAAAAAGRDPPNTWTRAQERKPPGNYPTSRSMPKMRITSSSGRGRERKELRKNLIYKYIKRVVCVVPVEETRMRCIVCGGKFAKLFIV